MISKKILRKNNKSKLKRKLVKKTQKGGEFKHKVFKFQDVIEMYKRLINDKRIKSERINLLDAYMLRDEDIIHKNISFSNKQDLIIELEIDKIKNIKSRLLFNIYKNLLKKQDIPTTGELESCNNQINYEISIAASMLINLFIALYDYYVYCENLVTDTNKKYEPKLRHIETMCVQVILELLTLNKEICASGSQELSKQSYEFIMKDNGLYPYIKARIKELIIARQSNINAGGYCVVHGYMVYFTRNPKFVEKETTKLDILDILFVNIERDSKLRSYPADFLTTPTRTPARTPAPIPAPTPARTPAPTPARTPARPPARTPKSELANQIYNSSMPEKIHSIEESIEYIGRRYLRLVDQFDLFVWDFDQTISIVNHKSLHTTIEQIMEECMINLEEFLKKNFFNGLFFVSFVLYIKSQGKNFAISSYGKQDNIQKMCDILFAAYGQKNPFKIDNKNIDSPYFEGITREKFLDLQNTDKKKESLLRLMKLYKISEQNRNKVIFFDDRKSNIDECSSILGINGVTLLQNNNNPFITEDIPNTDGIYGFNERIIMYIHDFVILYSEAMPFNINFTEKESTERRKQLNKCIVNTDYNTIRPTEEAIALCHTTTKARTPAPPGRKHTPSGNAPSLEERLRLLKAAMSQVMESSTDNNSGQPTREQRLEQPTRVQRLALARQAFLELNENSNDNEDI